MPFQVRKVIPVRSKNAVNKSIKDKRSSATDNPAKASNKAEDNNLDEVFQKQLEIVISLLPTVSLKNLQPIRKWITKLFDPTVQKSKRNFYLSYLLFQIQNLKILDPFDKTPPLNLVDASKFSGAAKWKTLSQDANKDYHERARERICVQEWSHFIKDFKKPSDFLNDQPLPINGVVCYGGCFSNHF